MESAKRLATAADNAQVRQLHADLCAQLGVPVSGRKGLAVKDALSEAWGIGVRRATEAMSAQLRDHGITFEVEHPAK